MGETYTFTSILLKHIQLLKSALLFLELQVFVVDSEIIFVGSMISQEQILVSSIIVVQALANLYHLNPLVANSGVK